MWDAVSGNEQKTLAYNHIVKTVDFPQDSNYLLTGKSDRLLLRYNLHKPEAGPKEIGDHTFGFKNTF